MNKKSFDIMMNTFAKVYKETLDPEVLIIYFNVFKEIEDSQVEYITRECLKKCHFFPRPADIFEHSDPYKKYYEKE